LDASSFYLTFIVLFTVLAFVAGAIMAFSAMSMNAHHPRVDDADEAGH
jgi:hypothetical protein